MASYDEAIPPGQAGHVKATIKTDKLKEIRGRGLWFGIEFKKEAGVARQYCEALMHDGMLCKDTHAQTMRLAPPLCITRDEVDWALERLEKIHPRQAEVVQHHYFGGLTNEEAAEAMGVSLRTVERDLRFARAWLSKTWSGTMNL